MKVTDFINGKVSYDKEGQYFWIRGSNNVKHMLAELRGWGHIKNMFKDGDGNIHVTTAEMFHDEVGEWVADAINVKLERESKQLKISCNPVLSEVSPPSDQYPDNEADGIVFCGKCGKQK